ncbi:MAG: hypothetical protein U0996_20890 [Planctomycetaceae bacterium]
MDVEIVEVPKSFVLVGLSGQVENNAFGPVGMKLMNELWRIVKGTGTPNSGVNLWVYLPGSRMFTGVELLPGAEAPAGLESLNFELPRYLKHVHIGPYQALPVKWMTLKTEIAARGERMGPYSLEIYGHHSDDPAATETTILIGLGQTSG